MSRWQSVTLTADETCVTSTFPPSVRNTDTLKMSSAWENKNLKISYPHVQQAYTHLCIHLCKNTYMLIHIQEYTDVHAYICAYLYIQVHTCIFTHIYIPTSMHIHIYINIHTYTQIHIYMHVYIQAHMHMYKHMHACMFTELLSWKIHWTSKMKVNLVRFNLQKHRQHVYWSSFLV